MSVLPAEVDKARYVRAMFARIVARYDLLNDLMTAGRHRHWKRLAAAAVAPAGARALDLGCGTGDLARELLRQGARSVVCADTVPAMLAAACRKLAGAGKSSLVVADALALPFQDASFDCVISGFLVRNVADPLQALREMRRVLVPGGRVVCLDAARRDGPLGRVLHGAFGISARLLGRLVARDAAAYAYLPASAAAFCRPDELAALMRMAGFERVQHRGFGLGLIAIHRAWTPATAGAGILPDDRERSARVTRHASRRGQP